MKQSFEMPPRRDLDDGSEERPDRGRRKALRLLGAATAGALAGPLLQLSCAGGEGPPGVLEVSLDELPLGQRIRVLHGENPIELLRTEEGVGARSLWCTHYGCEVAWSPDRQVYLCPCHDGVFDAEGRVEAGPPPRPLSRVEIREEKGSVFIGSPAV